MEHRFRMYAACVTASASRSLNACTQAAFFVALAPPHLARVQGRARLLGLETSGFTERSTP